MARIPDEIESLYGARVCSNRHCLSRSLRWPAGLGQPYAAAPGLPTARRQSEESQLHATSRTPRTPDGIDHRKLSANPWRSLGSKVWPQSRPSPHPYLVHEAPHVRQFWHFVKCGNSKLFVCADSARSLQPYRELSDGISMQKCLSGTLRDRKLRTTNQAVGRPVQTQSQSNPHSTSPLHIAYTASSPCIGAADCWCIVMVAES